MDIRVGNKIIIASIYDILVKLRAEKNNSILRDIIDRQDNVTITCPFHKDGKENRPSCNIYQGTQKNIPVGTVSCFTCHYTNNFFGFIGDCFDEDENFGKEWLRTRFDTAFVEESFKLPEIVLDDKKYELREDESDLKNYVGYHDYMWKRKLTKDVVDKFGVGYDKKMNAITFPVYDDKHRYVMTTKRSTVNKNFYIPKLIKKPVYLLYYILENNITDVYVCESQINTLYLYTMGLNAIGLFGTGSYDQYALLRKSGIRSYHIALDGDKAGKKGTLRLIQNLPKDCFVDIVELPDGKDANDLSKDEFLSLNRIDSYSWLNKYKHDIENNFE